MSFQASTATSLLAAMQSGQQQQQQQPPPSSLPGAGNHGIEEDWTAVKDPKEKKRIQNRIAQRSYRRRLKARLEKLQSKVDYHERLRLQGSDKEDADMITESSGARNPELNPNPSPIIAPVNNNQVVTPATTAETLASRSPEEPQAMPHAFFAQPMDDGDRNLFGSRAVPVIGENGQSSAQPLSRHLSPLPNPPEHDGKVQDKLFMHYARLPKAGGGGGGGQDKLDTQQDEGNFLNFEPQRDNAQTELRNACNTSMGRAEQATHLFTPEESSSIDFDFNASSDVWKTDILTPPSRQTTATAPPFSSARQPSAASDAHIDLDGLDSGCGVPPISPDISADNTSLDESLEFILECAETIGFDNFDSLVTTYYNESFCESSPLCNEQRLSRNRRLPKVLADIFQAADSWSDWERHGLRDEILKQTESVLISEGKNATNTIRSGMNPLVDPQNAANAASSMHALLGMKRTVRNELPNLWALMMGLAAQNRNLRKQDQSNTVLAIVILLQGSGSIPNEQLLRLLTMCLIDRDGDAGRLNAFL